VAGQSQFQTALWIDGEANRRRGQPDTKLRGTDWILLFAAQFVPLVVACSLGDALADVNLHLVAARPLLYFAYVETGNTSP